MQKLAVVGIALALYACDSTTLEPVAGPVLSQYGNNAALVIDPAGTCYLLNGDGVIVETSDSKVVLTQSSNGNKLLRCQATVANSTGRAVTYDTNNNPFFPGFECGAPLGGTTNWHQTVSASGEATLHCHFN